MLGPPVLDVKLDSLSDVLEIRETPECETGVATLYQINSSIQISTKLCIRRFQKKTWVQKNVLIPRFP